MARDRDVLREWHRLFGLLLTDYFTDSPFTVDVERDLSEQQQRLDVVIVRRSRGRFTGRLPDGLTNLVAHNLITFKSHREALDDWAMKELVGHYVAYRKLVSPSPSDLLPEEQFRLHAVCARFPHNLSGQVPWQQQQTGVYHCRWGTDVVTVIVAGELPRETQNAPLHLFSASTELLAYGRSVYRQHSETTSLLLRRLFARLQEEGLAMSFTMQDFRREYFKEEFANLTPEERREFLCWLSPEEQREIMEGLSPEQRREVLQSLPPEERLAGLPPEQRLAGLLPEERLAGLSPEQIQQYLDQLTAGQPTGSRKPRRKK
jgi:DNA-binding MarR family transcriptional regulator